VRADAKANRDRLLEAAARAFARDGADASLKAIAQDAGVGIGTLYRRFPTRESLVEATYHNETARLCAAAGELLGTMPPLAALRAWMDRFADLMATKHAMADALRAVLTSAPDRLRTRQELADAIGSLLAAGVAEGTVRSDLDSMDVLLGIGGLTLIAEDRALLGRLLDVFTAGLRQPAADARRRPAS
jgi:AcrR family transcriptional regulator